MRKQQHRKNHPCRTRSSGGQTTLQSFLFKPRVADEELNPSSRPRPPPPDDEDGAVSPPALPPKREIIRVTSKTIKEKVSAFSSVGSSSGKNGGRGGGGASTFNTAVLFKRFNSSPSSAAARMECSGSVEAGGEPDNDGSGREVRLDVEDIGGRGRGRESRKRKSPLRGGDEHRSANANHVVVLGDDLKPRPPPAMRRRGRTGGRGEGDHGLYNHYASGGGLWHEDREGVDGEEVGWTDDMWEGMGSITLGGMEWH